MNAYCPTCEAQVEADWYRDATTGWDCCPRCSTMLVDPATYEEEDR